MPKSVPNGYTVRHTEMQFINDYPEYFKRLVPYCSFFWFAERIRNPIRAELASMAWPQRRCLDEIVSMKWLRGYRGSLEAPLIGDATARRLRVGFKGRDSLWILRKGSMGAGRAKSPCE